MASIHANVMVIYVTGLKVLLIESQEKAAGMCAGSCSSAVIKENSKYVMVVKMNLLVKQWSVEMWWGRDESVPLLCSQQLHVHTSPYCCYGELLPLLKTQGGTHFESLSLPKDGHRFCAVKPIGPLKTVGKLGPTYAVETFSHYYLYFLEAALDMGHLDSGQLCSLT